jgi:hypothetical protein
MRALAVKSLDVSQIDRHTSSNAAEAGPAKSQARVDGRRNFRYGARACASVRTTHLELAAAGRVASLRPRPPPIRASLRLAGHHITYALRRAEQPEANESHLSNGLFRDRACHRVVLTSLSRQLRPGENRSDRLNHSRGSFASSSVGRDRGILEGRTLWDHAGLEIAPQVNDQTPGDGDNPDFPCHGPAAGKTLGVPLCQRSVSLMDQSAPRNLNRH